MGTLYRLEEARRQPGKSSSRQRIFFNRNELNRLLSLYSRRVMSGEWRDYALDQRDGMAVFSIFRHSHENPLFAIAKRQRNQGSRGVDYVVFSGAQRLSRSESLEEALKVFEKQLRLVRAGPA